MINNVTKDFFTTNISYIFLLVATIGDLLIPFLLAPFSGKYNHLTMVMSLLGNRNQNCHSIYNLWLVLAGMMFVIGGIKLFVDYTKKSLALSICLLLVILVYAIGACILSGIFSVGETKEMLTIPEKIHGYGSVLGFLLLTFAPLLIALLSFQIKDFVIGAISIIFFILSAIFFTLFVMADKESSARTIISFEGLWQRLSLLCMYAPIIVISLKKLFIN
ncbi:membrane protein [Oscillospiraceae bacterium]|nr:membrane protein [Oscillospiraceae bacterium]BDF75700.1 membrane protein [Oscillospiraceae bacterium]